VSGTV
jgi:sphinganine-1-phosphate aldolase